MVSYINLNILSDIKSRYNLFNINDNDNNSNISLNNDISKKINNESIRQDIVNKNNTLNKDNTVNKGNSDVIGDRDDTYDRNDIDNKENER